MTQEQYVLIGVASGALVLVVVLVLFFVSLRRKERSGRPPMTKSSVAQAGPQRVGPSDIGRASGPASQKVVNVDTKAENPSALSFDSKAHNQLGADSSPMKSADNRSQTNDSFALGGRVGFNPHVPEPVDSSASTLLQAPGLDAIAEKAARPTSTLVAEETDTFEPRFTPDAWQTRWSTPTLAQFGEDFLTLPPAEHALSEAIPTKPGEVWECEFVATPLGASTNGGAVNFYVGPVVRNAEGKLLTWWQEQEAFVEGEGIRDGRVKVIAPVGAVSVHIGMLASFCEPPATTANVHMRFSNLKLRRLMTE